MDFKKYISKIISNEIENLSEDVILPVLETPANTDMGDIAFPCFKLAKEYKKSPNIIAEDIANNISNILSEYVALEKVQNIGGYVNFFVNKTEWIKNTIEEVLLKDKNFGRSCLGRNKNAIVEFSSPNIAKPFHIGHIRTTVIGHSLYRIYDFIGFDTISINHLGDYGTQFGKLIVAIKNWSDMKEIAKDPIKNLLELYVKFHKEAEKNPQLEDESRYWFKKLEDGDKEAYDMWYWIREISLKEFSKVYDLLNIKFDSYAGESFYSDKMPNVLKTMIEKGILVDSQGAQIIDLEQFGMPPALITKKDGSTLYITRDIAAAIYRKQTYDFYKCVYVVGAPQELHFRQLKKILELMGNEWYSDCIHVPFGTVSLEEGTLSTRKGNVVFLEDVLNKAIEKTKDIINEKNPNLDNIDMVAKQVGVGAIIFQELSNSRIKDYQFSWSRTLSFEGETGPYVQYAHARCCSLLEKSNKNNFDDINFDILSKSSDAIDIIRVLSSFSDVITRAYYKNEPHHIARFSLDLAQSFNKFYHDNKILNNEEEIKNSYLALVKCVKIALRNALYLLGIEAPKRM